MDREQRPTQPRNKLLSVLLQFRPIRNQETNKYHWYGIPIKLENLHNWVKAQFTKTSLEQIPPALS
jgi:hypothetical protein